MEGVILKEGIYILSKVLNEEDIKKYEMDKSGKC